MNDEQKAAILDEVRNLADAVGHIRNGLSAGGTDVEAPGLGEAFALAETALAAAKAAAASDPTPAS